jgi:hypothetical protein
MHKTSRVIAFVATLLVGALASAAHSNYGIPRPFGPWREYAYMIYLTNDGWASKFIRTPVRPDMSIVACWQAAAESATADCFYHRDVHDDMKDDVELHQIMLESEDRTT